MSSNNNSNRKIFNHLITFCLISYFNSFAFSLFQNFIFDFVSQHKNITFRFNCGLQILSICNFVGSFFWTFIADKTFKHHYIQIFNSILYGLTVAGLITTKKIESAKIQAIIVIFLTLVREFTLGSFGGVSQGLQLNYLIRSGQSLSYISLISISQNLGTFSAMLSSYAIEAYGIEKKEEFIKGVLYFLNIIFSTFLLLFIAPRFVQVEVPHSKSDPNENKKDKNIISLFKIPSLTLLYISLTIAGIYKCIISNIIPTILKVHGMPNSLKSSCFAIRSLTELIIYLPLSKIKSHRSFFFITSFITSALSILIDLKFEFKSPYIYLSEFLKGYSRSVINFSSVLLFKTYATSVTLTQTQGLRNSAYNGLSCIIFGLLAIIFVPSDIYVPEDIKNEPQMKERLKKVLDNGYKYMMFLLIIINVPILIAKSFRKRNL